MITEIKNHNCENDYFLKTIIKKYNTNNKLWNKRK